MPETLDRITVEYTTDDDGIHLRCKRCQADLRAGYEPTLADLLRLWARHTCQLTDEPVEP